MTKKEIVEALEGLDDDAQVRAAHEGDVLEHPIVDILIENGEAIIEFRDEE